MTRARPARSVQRYGSRSPRVVLVAIAAFALALPLGIGMPPSVAAAGEAVFTPVADSYVDSTSPTSNFGSRNEFRTDGSPAVNAYLRFDVSGVSAFGSVRLRLYVRSTASQGVQVRPVGETGWGEGSITWSSAPAYGPIVASSGAAPAGTWLEIDVSSLVTHNGLVSFAITNPSSTALAIRSRESGEAPELIVETTGGSNQPPTASFGFSRARA